MIASAALLNACLITNRELPKIKVVFSGAGAAAIATARMFVSVGVARENIWMFDLHGLVYKGRTVDMFPEKDLFAQDSPPMKLAEVLVGADVFMGLSVGGILRGDMLQAMAPDPIVFAMANPDPEITYEEAIRAVPTAIVATGRSDFPNQVNNVLGFPFVFRGALDCKARAINEEMKVAAVTALAELARQDVPESVLAAYGLEKLRFGPHYIIPKPFDPRVLLWVAPAVAKAASESGVARRPITDFDAYRQQLERLVERSKEIIRPIMNQARLGRPRLVFPEGTHPRVLRAAQILVDEGICVPVLLGEAWKVYQRAEQNGINLHGVEIAEIHDDAQLERYSQALWKARQRRGLTYSAARAQCRNATTYGLMMVREGDAD